MKGGVIAQYCLVQVEYRIPNERLGEERGDETEVFFAYGLHV